MHLQLSGVDRSWAAYVRRKSGSAPRLHGAVARFQREGALEPQIQRRSAMRKVERTFPR
jgi:hypothetical protein